MSEIRTSAIWFDSANAGDREAGYFYDLPGQTPCAVIQISHGMCEYIGRYQEFAAFMVRNGFAVCGNDHLGHGVTSDGGIVWLMKDIPIVRFFFWDIVWEAFLPVCMRCIIPIRFKLCY